MAWTELVYRVRRRTEEGQGELLERLHRLQEEIAYYQGWLTTEAPQLGASYERLVEHVRVEVRPLLREAWSQPVRPPWEGTPEGEREPDVREASMRYLRDVRQHLSPWCWVRIR
jgi:hypothetical protein